MSIKVAVIEDDIPTSKQLRAWILSARPGIAVDAWFNGKARRPEKQEAPKKVLAVVEPPKKTPNKKR